MPFDLWARAKLFWTLGLRLRPWNGSEVPLLRLRTEEASKRKPCVAHQGSSGCLSEATLCNSLRQLWVVYRGHWNLKTSNHIWALRGLLDNWISETLSGSIERGVVWGARQRRDWCLRISSVTSEDQLWVEERNLLLVGGRRAVNIKSRLQREVTLPSHGAADSIWSRIIHQSDRPRAQPRIGIAAWDKNSSCEEEVQKVSLFGRLSRLGVAAKVRNCPSQSIEAYSWKTGGWRLDSAFELQTSPEEKLLTGSEGWVTGCDGSA